MFERTHRYFLRVTVLALGAGLWTPVAHALTVNPIDPNLPLSIHARAGCESGTVSYPGNVGNTFYTYVDHAVGSTCSGGVTQENPATLTSVASTSTARADLLTGEIGAVTIGHGYADSWQGLSAPTGATTHLYDTLTVNGSWTGVRTIELRLTIRGKLTATSPSAIWASSSFNGSLLLLTETGTFLGNAGINVTVGNNGVPFIASTGASVGTTLTHNAVNFVFDPNNVEFTMSFFFPATTANRTFSFLGRLQVFSRVGLAGFGAVEGTSDFGNPGKFALIVPADVSVTSASGKFLAGGAPIPVFPLLVDGVR